MVGEVASYAKSANETAKPIEEGEVP